MTTAAQGATTAGPRTRRRWPRLAVAVGAVALTATWQLLARSPGLAPGSLTQYDAESAWADERAIEAHDGSVPLTDPSDGTYDGVWTFRNTGPIPVTVRAADHQVQSFEDVHLVAVDPAGALGEPVESASLAPGESVGVAFSFGFGCGTFSAGTGTGTDQVNLRVTALGVSRTVAAVSDAPFVVLTTHERAPERPCDFS